MSNDTPTKQRVDETQECDMGALAYQLAEEMDTLRERLAEAERDLRFVERWANHHGQKPHVTPKEILSTIQHYPPILAITRSYADGKVPETENPWERALAAEALAEQNAKDAERYRWLRSGPSVTEGKFPSEPWTVRVRAEPWPTLGPCEGNELDAAIDAARSAT